MNADRTVPADAMWVQVEPFLPGKATNPGATAADNRLFLKAVLRRVRTGSPRRDLPERFGKWNSVFERFRRSALSRVFEPVFNVLSDEFDFDCVAQWSRRTIRRSAQKGNLLPSDRPLPRRSDEQDPRGCGHAWLPSSVDVFRRQRGGARRALRGHSKDVKYCSVAK